MNILLVDDEQQYRLLMRSLLSAEGWTVYLAEDGEHALEVLGKEKMDIVISDIYMPIMDGIKLHKKLRESEKYATLPVLFVSAFDDQYTMNAVKQPKLDGFIKKGRPGSELKEWVKYLTTSEEERPKMPPGRKMGIGL